VFFSEWTTTLNCIAKWLYELKYYELRSALNCVFLDPNEMCLLFDTAIVIRLFYINNIWMQICDGGVVYATLHEKPGHAHVIQT
jgi:hypothetical protein